MISGEGKRFNRTMVARIRSNYDLEARYSRLRARGMLTLAEIAKRLGISAATAKTWRRAGLLRSYRYNGRGETLFEQPGPNTPIKYRISAKIVQTPWLPPWVVTQSTHEVHYAAQAFCQGERAAVGRSRMPMARTRRMNRAP